MSFKPVTNRIVLALLVIAGLSAAPASAATSEFRILVNRDLNLNSGCDLTPTPPNPPGPPATRGLEQILTATVTTGPGTATVSSITQQACTDSSNDIFDVATAVSGAVGAVGQNNGTAGFDVVEFCVPASVLGSGPPPQARIGLLSSNTVGGTDQLLTPDGGNGNQPIFLALGFTPPIPTLSEWGLILMALLLAVAAATRLRKRPVVGGLVVLCILSMTGVALAVTIDGQIGDWLASDKLGDDPAGDAPLGADIRALFGKTENNQVCFRIDAALDIPPPNGAPTADNDSYSVDEGGTLNVPVPGVLDGDTDPESDPLTAVLVTGPAHGTLTLNANGSFTYTHDGSETPTTDTFTYRANDGAQNSNIATVTITINALNDAPVAVNDSFSVAEGGTLNQAAPGVLANDSDPEGNTLTTVLDSGPAHGTLTLNANGSFTYTHDGSETPPTDSFTYHVTDGTANSNVATVVLTITGANDPPTAVDDAFSVAEGGTLNQSAPGVLANDSDPEGNTLTAVLDSGPAHASSFTLNADGSFTYVHDGSETPSTDTFTYHANDGTSNSNVVTVTLTITATNDTPTADNDAFSVSEGGTLNQPAPGVLGGDVDPDGDTLTAVLDSGPAHASSFTLNADGSFTYVHDGSETPLTDTFTYHANDGTTNSNIATVTITITGANDAPVAFNDSYSVNEGGTLTTTPVTGVLVNDVDPDSSLTAVLDSGPAHASSFTLNADGSFTYVHDGSETPTTDTFTYHAFDGAASSNIATVTITITAVNDAPVLDLDADDSGGTTGSDYAITFTDGDPARFIEDVADATITDADSANLTTLTVTLTNLLDPGFEVLDVDLTGANAAFSKTYDTTTDPTKGVLTITASPARPVAEFVALLRKVTYINTDDDPTTTARIIQFVVSDGTSNSNTATTTVTINAANDAPTAVNDSYSVNEGGTLNQAAPGVLANDTDPEGNTLTAVLDSTTAHGTLTLNSDGSFTYVHDGSETPTTDTFTYHANDGTANSNVATVTITINAVNDAPTAVNDSYNVNEGGTLNQAAPGVIGNDTDPEGNTLTAVLDSTTAHGTLTLNANGSFTYIHDGSETPTTDTFTYHVNDGTANSNVATVTIAINPVNDAPAAVADAYNVNEGGTLNQPAPGVLGNDTDPEGNTLTAVLDSTTAHGILTLNANGSFTYTHDGSETPLTDSFTYHANDGTANSNIVTVTITINPVNDAPVAVADAYNVNEGGTLNQAAPGVLGNDTDAEGNTLTAVLNTGPAHGTLTLNPNGSFTYTHDGSETPLTDSFTYHANDGTADSNIVTVTITINPVNDPPVANPDTADITEEAPNVPAANTVSGNVLTNDTDPDSSLVVSVVAGGAPGVPHAGSFGSVVVNSNGSFTYTLDDANPTVNALKPGQTLIETFNYTASDGSLTSSSTLTVTIHGADDPATPDNDAFDFIGNTELRVDLGAGATPAALETTPSNRGVADGDIDPEGDAIVVSGIVGCADLTPPFDCVIAGQGTVSLQADGRFSFVPEAGDTDATATFQYTLVGNPAPATVTLTRFERVWYVKNDAPAGGLGRSTDPFDTLAEAQTASLANDYIFVYFGDGSTTGQNAGIALKNGQHLIGQHTGLSLPVNLNGNGSPTNLVNALAGSRPLLDDTVVGGNEGVTANNVLPAEIVGLNLAGNVNAIDWTTTAAFSGTGSAFSIRDNVIRSTTNDGVDINLAGTSAVSLAFHDNDITATGNGLDIQETGTGSLTITQFANNVVSGNTGGTGINIANVTFDAVAGGGIDPVSGGATVIGASGNTVGQAGLLISGMTGTLNFTDLDIFTNGGAGLSIAGTGTATTNLAVGAGVSIIEANGGPAVNVSQATVDLQLSSLKSTNSTGTGVSLDNVNGTFSAGSGSSIATAAGTDFNVNAGTATISYAGTITNTAGRSVSITNKTSGSTSFTGAITDTGTGVFLNSNTGSTMSFSGGLSLTTTSNDAFTATGGGTVAVTGSSNTITTTTGIGLNVANTTIGASGLTFRSISAGTVASGPSSGIILNNTGTSAGLTVAGTGGAGTGGTIQNCTGDGISLTSARNISLSWMNVTGNDNNGISGTSVTNLTLSNMKIQNNTDALVEAGLKLRNVFGTNSITNTEVSGSTEDNVNVTNDTNTSALTSLTFSGAGCSIHDNSTGSGNVGINIQANLTAVMNGVVVDGCTFQGNRTVSIRGDGADTAQLNMTVRNNVITAGSPNQGNQGIELSAASTAQVTFDIDNNRVGTNGVTNSPLLNTGINVSAGTTSSMTGFVRNNTVVNAGAGLSGFGIRVFQSSGASIRANVNNNVVSNVGLDYGLLVESGGSAGSTGRVDVAVSNNNISVLAGALDAVRAQARNASTMCARITGNTTNHPNDPGCGGANPSSFCGLVIRQANTAVFNLEGSGGSCPAGAQTAAQAATCVASQNSEDSFGSFAATNFTGVATNSCTNIP